MLQMDIRTKLLLTPQQFIDVLRIRQTSNIGQDPRMGGNN